MEQVGFCVMPLVLRSSKHYGPRVRAGPAPGSASVFSVVAMYNFVDFLGTCIYEY